MSAMQTPPLTSQVFAADDSILGFKYQLRYALLLLFEARGSSNSDVAIDIERIDDIDVHTAGTLTKLVQTKNTSTVLTNSSAPLWKTLRIWSEAIRRAEVNPETITSFSLVTTSSSPDNESAIVNLLKADTCESRLDALSQLRSLAAANKSQNSLGSAYKAFDTLLPIQQQNLVHKIRIITSAPSFDELDQRICNHIVHGPPGKCAAFAKVLFGRWDVLVEDYLRSTNRTKIPWQQLQSLLHEISLQFTEDNLPTTFAGMLRDAFPSLSDDNRTFMRQLAAVSATEPQRQRAQRHYLKATQLLGFWQRHLLVRPDEILLHRERLIEECDLQHEKCEADPELATLAPEVIGMRVYVWAIDHAPHQEALRVRAQCCDPDVIRGSFHALSDAAVLGWHPDWKSKFAPSSSGD